MKIMAPAGSLESMNAAIRAGADEVYMGIAGFGARRFAKNFSVQEYCDAVGEAHRFGTAVNVTLNTIMAEEEFEALGESLEMLYAAGTDAVIVQDPGFAAFLKKYFPDWPRHASTQLSIANPEEARWAEAQGFSRLVLARELDLDEIAAIRNAVSAELEVFASGALCIACSGKCFLSSFIGGRSGNRGMCTQPCRQKYRLMEPEGNQKAIREGFFLSSCDQWQEFPELLRLAVMGVEILKLEGRMKSPEYVFQAVRYYREILDALNSASSAQLEALQEKVLQAPVRSVPKPEIARLFNRGYSKGYFHAHDPNFINAAFSASWGVKVGEIQERKIRLTEPLRNGDGVVFLDRELQKLDGLNVGQIQLDETGEVVPEAPQGAEVTLEVPVPSKARFLYRTFDHALDRQIASEMKRTRRRTPVSARLSARVGELMEVEFSAEVHGKTFRAVSRSIEPLAVSQKHPTEKAALLDGLSRLGETPFSLDEKRAELDFAPDAFVPRSLLNQLRQEAAAELERKIIEGMKRTPVFLLRRSEKDGSGEERPTQKPLPETILERKPTISAAVQTLAQAEACRRAGIEKIYRLEPPVHFGSEVRPESNFPFSPLAGSLFDAVEYSRQERRFALDWTFHAANPETLRFFHEAFPHCETFFLSPELSETTVRKLALFAAQNEEFPQVGLPIFGFLYGMFTRKTLFDVPLQRLWNQDGRPVYVTRNSDSENPLETTGSRVYYGNRMDISRRLHASPIPGLSELRLDFTLETPEETEKIVRLILTRGWIQETPFSYGFEKGIF